MGDSLDFVKVFHKIYSSRLADSFQLRPRPSFSCGQGHDTSTGRHGWPRHPRALVRARRAAARLSHRIVRDRALAPLSQRTGFLWRISGKPRPRWKPGAIFCHARHPATTGPSTCPGLVVPRWRCRAARSGATGFACRGPWKFRCGSRSENSLAPEAKPVGVEEAFSGPAIDEGTTELMQRLAAIVERYPLLRNTF